MGASLTCPNLSIFVQKFPSKGNLRDYVHELLDREGACHVLLNLSAVYKLRKAAFWRIQIKV